MVRLAAGARFSPQRGALVSNLSFGNTPRLLLQRDSVLMVVAAATDLTGAIGALFMSILAGRDLQ